jgi:hypothetical protein
MGTYSFTLILDEFPDRFEIWPPDIRPSGKTPKRLLHKCAECDI